MLISLLLLRPTAMRILERTHRCDSRLCRIYVLSQQRTALSCSLRRALVAAYTSPCAVCDRVLLGVNCGDFVVITNHRRMRASREVSVVSLSYDSIISDDNTTNLKFLARRTCCCKRSQLFKIFAPCRSFFHSMV
jgi:hypothetical protein